MTDFAPLPDGRYPIIYADPPWAHSAQIRDGVVGTASDHYRTVPTEDLCRLPVRDVAADKSLLFMWAVSPMLPDAMRLGEAWGFRYATVAFVWEKGRIVPGCYTLSSCELCLVFRRGGIPQPRGVRNARQFVQVERGHHSAKPHQVRDAIDAMFPAQKKLELFARPNGDDIIGDWTFWGNEVVSP